MINVLEDFKKSNAWSLNYNLPIVEFHNNPHLYMAYAYKIIRLWDKESAAKIIPYFYLYASQCQINFGLFYRYPDKRGGPTSHDELIGIASMSEFLAKHIYNYIKNHNGVYDNGEDPHVKYRFFRYNLYRFPWAIVYIKACAGYKLSCFDKFVFNLFLKLDMINYKGSNEGGRLRIWLMLDVMEKHIPKTVKLWKKDMRAHGLSPKECFTFYLSECPVYHQYAPNLF